MPTVKPLDIRPAPGSQGFIPIREPPTLPSAGFILLFLAELLLAIVLLWRPT